eukprot:TRINITY_DN10669_c0_g2_i1.p1 TRINITY_DN10669_c0_g2~~TRINITY_DN10669_c0_g2_i1.p1  ORF type:complete len:118 (-),score=5.84 TRINITY_DN10669_c0_g2_i1:283-585(-)
MDRTESRLRVASTPAPVAMRERLKDDDNDMVSGDAALGSISFPRVCDSNLPAEKAHLHGHVAEPVALRNVRAGNSFSNEGRPHIAIDCHPGVDPDMIFMI